MPAAPLRRDRRFRWLRALALRQSGGRQCDLFGESAYLVGRDGLINIVIDHITP